MKTETVSLLFLVSKRWSINGKEFDTYKVGTVANSCSTMHKIAAKEFTIDDFSHDHLFDDDEYCSCKNQTEEFPKFEEINGDWIYWTPMNILNQTVAMLNFYRDAYNNATAKLKRDDLTYAERRHTKAQQKNFWWQMIQLLPSSYNQRRTVMLNYEVLANIYKSRRNHRLDEWHTFCEWIETLPYSELITGKEKE